VNKLLSAAAVVGVIASGPADAQHANLVGFGAVTGGCGKWISEPENSVADIGYLSWIVGYASGLNVMFVAGGSGDFLDKYDGYSLGPWAKIGVGPTRSTRFRALATLWLSS
jgi:hypothetical protein